MNEQKDCINPDISLSELYHIRSKYIRRIQDIKKNPEKNATMTTVLKSVAASLQDINDRIAVIENTGNNGGIIRII